jgi:hypothetical protein
MKCQVVMFRFLINTVMLLVIGVARGEIVIQTPVVVEGHLVANTGYRTGVPQLVYVPVPYPADQPSSASAYVVQRAQGQAQGVVVSPVVAPAASSYNRPINNELRQNIFKAQAYQADHYRH